MEKLENKLVDMRDMYEERKDPHNCQRLPAIKVYIYIYIHIYISYLYISYLIYTPLIF